MMVQRIDSHFPSVCRSASPLVADLNLPSAMMPLTSAARFGTTIIKTITALNAMLAQCRHVTRTLLGCIFYKFSQAINSAFSSLARISTQ